MSDAVKVPGLRSVNGNGIPDHIARDIQASFRTIQPAITAAVKAVQATPGASTAQFIQQLAQLSTLVGVLNNKVNALVNASIGVPLKEYPPAAEPLLGGDYFIVSRDGTVLTVGTMADILGYIITGLLSQSAAGTALLGSDLFLLSADGTTLEVGTLTQLADYVLSQRNILVSQFAPGVPVAAAFLARWQIEETMELPAGLTGSGASAEVAATGAIALPILKNAVTVGAVNFAASSSVATFTFAGTVMLAPGDVLKIQNAVIADATLASISFTLRGIAA